MIGALDAARRPVGVDHDRLFVGVSCLGKGATIFMV
jgi:hypothetical protein